METVVLELCAGVDALIKLSVLGLPENGKECDDSSDYSLKISAPAPPAPSSPTPAPTTSSPIKEPNRAPAMSSPTSAPTSFPTNSKCVADVNINCRNPDGVTCHDLMAPAAVGVGCGKIAIFIYTVSNAGSDTLLEEYLVRDGLPNLLVDEQDILDNN
jgi:hypothetical protein